MHGALYGAAYFVVPVADVDISYLLSPQTSPLGGLGSSSRLTLLGSPPPTASPAFYKDPDPIIFSEIAEFAMGLATPTKGQEPFAGLPHLQPYRLIRAACLAELGNVQLANRYVNRCRDAGFLLTWRCE